MTMIVAFIMSATIAKGYNVSRYDIESTNDLKKAIHYMVKSEFKNTDGFFVKNSVEKLKQKVDTEFIITDDNTIKVVKVNCPDCIAKKYVMEVLHNQKIKADDLLKNRRYKVVINIDYRS